MCSIIYDLRPRPKLTKLFVLLLLIIFIVNGQYRKNVARQVLQFAIHDTTLTPPGLITANDSSALSAQVYKDSAVGVVASGKFGPLRNPLAGLTGYYYFIDSTAADFNADALTFTFASTTANHICDPVFIKTQGIVGLDSFTVVRAQKIDSLKHVTADVAVASTALSTANWTTTRSGYLDTLNTAVAKSAKLTTLASSVAGDSINNLTHSTSASLTSDSLAVTKLRASMTQDSTNVLLMAKATSLTGDSNNVLTNKTKLTALAASVTGDSLTNDSIMRHTNRIGFDASSYVMSNAQAMGSSLLYAVQHPIQVSIAGDSINNLANAKAINLTADSLLVIQLRTSLTGDSTNNLTNTKTTVWTNNRAGYLDTLQTAIAKSPGQTTTLNCIRGDSLNNIGHATIANQVIITGITRTDSLRNTTNLLNTTWTDHKATYIDTNISKISGGGGGGSGGSSVTSIDSALSINHGNGAWGSLLTYSNSVLFYTMDLNHLRIPSVFITFKNKSGSNIQDLSTNLNGYGVTTLPSDTVVIYPWVSGYSFITDTIILTGNKIDTLYGSQISITPPASGCQTLYVLKSDIGLIGDTTAVLTAQIFTENTFSGQAVLTGKKIIAKDSGTYFYWSIAKGVKIQIIGNNPSTRKEFLNENITITNDDTKALSTYTPF